MTSCTGSARRILGIWRKLGELRTRHRTRRLTFACSRRPWASVAQDGGGAQMKKPEQKDRASLSLCRKTIKLKGNKSLVPEQRSRKCFSCFELPTFCVIYIYEYHMSILNMVVSGYGTIYYEFILIDWLVG